MEEYIDGWFAGEAVAYCEALRLGSRLAAQISCEDSHAAELLDLIAKEGCRVDRRRHGRDRVSIWIYRDERVKGLIDALDALPTCPLGMWAMGKLFGYGDKEVLEFIQKNEPTDDAHPDPHRNR